MKSIKPGRGPSMMSSVMSILVGIFGVFWTIAAASMGAPAFFCLFGVVFVIIAIVQAVYHFKNASSANRYSVFDITDENEEPDPLNKHFGRPSSHAGNPSGSSFCPYCGAPVQAGFSFCRKCGREQPRD